jgi:hypothetical protein
MLSKNDCDYIVTVFFTGHSWQISKYQPNDPTNLFSKVLGICVHKERSHSKFQDGI